MLGLPNVHDAAWDPLWEAVCEHDLVVCLHIGSSGHGVNQLPGGPLSPSVVLISTYAMNAATELLFSTLFERWPNLRFAMSEGGIGWVPYILERAEYTWGRHRYWTGDADVPNPMDLYRRHFGVCFIEDHAGIRDRDLIGVDTIMWEGDYPHTDSSWPNSREKLALQLKDCTPDEVEKITHANAERMFRFPLAEA
jgi:predicted TIM-barrel fold metal-dependent hydrolase